jgi:hypothetical protein
MVELAIMMLVLIPVLTYGIFLMDAAYMKLDLQETAVSGAWDLTTLNTQPNSGDHDANTAQEIDATAAAVRIVYSDHTSTFDDGGDPAYDGYGQAQRLKSSVDHKRHHRGFGANYSFHFSSGEDTQFHCNREQRDQNVDRDLGWLYEPNMRAYGTSRFVVGGQATCKAKGYIYNYIIPQTFMQEFAGETKVTTIKKRITSTSSEDTHSAETDRAGDAFLETRATAAVSFNTWALLNGSNDGTLTANSADIGARNMLGINTGPNLGNNPFYQRVKHMNTRNGLFMVSYLNVVGQGAQLMQKAASEKLMVVVSAPVSNIPVLPNIVDTHLTARYQPGTPGVHQRPPGPGGLMHSGFQSTPYRGVNNNYTQAYNNRGGYYLGCKQAEGRNCN